MLTIKNAAKYLEVSSDTLRRWDEEGKLIPTKRTSSGYRLYSKTLLKNIKIQLQTLGKSHTSGRKLLSENQQRVVQIIDQMEDQVWEIKKEAKWAFFRTEKFFKHNSLVFWFLTVLVLFQFLRLMAVNLYSLKLLTYIAENNNTKVLGVIQEDPFTKFALSLNSDFKNSDLPRTGN